MAVIACGSWVVLPSSSLNGSVTARYDGTTTGLPLPVRGLPKTASSCVRVQVRKSYPPSGRLSIPCGHSRAGACRGTQMLASRSGLLQVQITPCLQAPRDHCRSGRGRNQRKTGLALEITARDLGIRETWSPIRPLFRRLFCAPIPLHDGIFSHIAPSSAIADLGGEPNLSALQTVGAQSLDRRCRNGHHPTNPRAIHAIVPKFYIDCN